MRRKKILLLQTAYHPSNYLMEWVERYFPSHQHLLVKLFLLFPTDMHKQIYADLGESKSNTRMTNAHKRIFIPEGSLEYPPVAHQTREYEATFQAVLAESQFADLLILEETLYQTPYQYHKKATTVQALLQKVSCPIMVLPENHALVEQIILFYDGTYRTFSLIQQFIHDFCQFSSVLPTTLLLLQSNPLSAPEEKRLIEYLKLNCHDLAVHKISAESQHTFPVAIDIEKCALIVQSRRRQLPDYVADHLNALKKVTLTMD